MNLIQILLIIIIIVFVMLFIIRSKQRQTKTIIKYIPTSQHPIYPFINYDIREVLPPSRRTYLRYPYYFHRNGIYLR